MLTMNGEPKASKFPQTKRISGVGNDVWSMVNSAAAASPIQPMANLGQGFFGYNPPQWVLDAHKNAINKVECNQYSPTKGRPDFKIALARSYTPLLGHDIDPTTEISVTTGANEGMLCALTAFVEPGEEVIVMEPFFDQYILTIELVGAKIKYVPLIPPADGCKRTHQAAEWRLDTDALTKAVTPKTKAIIINSPCTKVPPPPTGLQHGDSHNPLGKIFSHEELTAIANICVEHNILVLSDEVYDRLYYVPFTRIATLNPQIAEQTLTIGSLGKTFYATGWRVGYVIGPKELIKGICEAHRRICYTTPGPPQEAGAVGFSEAEKRGFWDQARNDMKAKMDRLNAVWDEIGLPYVIPQGGYFVLVNTQRIKIPKGYQFPVNLQKRSRDFKLSWFLIREVGVAAIPPTDFYSPSNAHLAEDYLRFAVCKNEDVLDLAKERLRGLKKFIL